MKYAPAFPSRGYVNVCTQCHKECAEDERRKAEQARLEEQREQDRLRAEEQQRLELEAQEERERQAAVKDARLRLGLKQRDYVFKNYGITWKQYLMMYRAQNARCAMCKLPHPPKRFGLPNENQVGNPLVVDHCHKTGKVRGLLCLTCNEIEGKLKSDPYRAQEALVYIEHYQDHDNPAIGNVIAPKFLREKAREEENARRKEAGEPPLRKRRRKKRRARSVDQ